VIHSLGVPGVDIVICSARGREKFLCGCLSALVPFGTLEARVLVVSSDRPGPAASCAGGGLPELTEILVPGDSGYAASANYGAGFGNSPYILFLNDDARLDATGIAGLVERLEASPDLAAVQPKILSSEKPTRFDYAGAAGGYLDLLGYPFLRGRIGLTLEEDRGQYDGARSAFWASGAALLIRRAAFESAGGFDPDFRWHMEEIDLAWRLHLMGWRIGVVPEVRAVHFAGYAPGRMSARTTFLKHRNNLATLIKNSSAGNLARYLPLRLLLDILLVIGGMALLHWRSAFAVIGSYLRTVAGLPRLIRMRRGVQQLRKVPDAELDNYFYPGSVLLTCLLRKEWTFGGLGWHPPDRESGPWSPDREGPPPLRHRETDARGRAP
jgi:GT2 family glycosyltransferase